MASAVSRGGGSSSVHRLSPEIHKKEEPESRPLPSVEERIARVQERFQEKFQSFKKQVGSAIAKNNERLYEIDPHLVGKSRWDEPKDSERCCFEETSWGELFANIFSYIGSAFSSWWKGDEVARLQTENQHLSQLGSKKFEDFSEGDFKAFKTHDKLFNDASELRQLKSLENRLSRRSVVYSDEVGEPIEKTRKFPWTKNDRATRSKETRARLKKVPVYQALRRAGMLNHDKRCETYGNFEDQRDAISFDEVKVYPRRHKTSLIEANARWNAYYNSES